MLKSRMRKISRKYTSQTERDYILKMLLLSRSQNAFCLSEKQHAEIIKRAKKDYAAANRATRGE